MKAYLYAVRDAAAGSYFPPFMAVNDAVAVRSFNTACSNSGSPLHDSPGDYDLYLIAEYDQETGVVVGVDHTIVARGE